MTVAELAPYQTVEKPAERYSLETYDTNVFTIVMLLGISADAVQGKTRDEILRVIGNGISYDELMDVLKEIQVDSTEREAFMSSKAVCVKDTETRLPVFTGINNQADKWGMMQ